MKILGRSFAFLLLSVQQAFAEDLLPTAPGTSWEYEMIQEAGKGVSFSGLKPDADGKVRLPVTYRIGDEQTIDGKAVRKFEMHRAGVVTNTDLLAVDAEGITCYARISEEGARITLEPPQKMLTMPLKTGTKWEYEGKIAGEEVRQKYSIVAEEEVEVPAGRFRAFKVRTEQTEGGPGITVDRWFVPGVGFVKDVTTMNMPNGALLQRISLELKERPKIGARPEVKPGTARKKMSVGLAREKMGEVTTEFAPDVAKIYARWQGSDLQTGTAIRAVWIAEDVGAVAPPNYKVDESILKVPEPDAAGTFTLGRPTNGWPVGKYRVEIHVGDELAETVKFTIGPKSP